MKLVINEWDRLKFQFKNKKKIKKILFHNDIHPKNVLIKKRWKYSFTRLSKLQTSSPRNSFFPILF